MRFSFWALLLAMALPTLPAQAQQAIPPNTWVRVAPPSALNPGSGGDVHFAFDPRSERIFNFFGDIYWSDAFANTFGSTGDSYRRTVLAYSVKENRWTVEVRDDDPQTPAGRCQPGVAYDSGRGVFYVYGGVSSRPPEGHPMGGVFVYEPVARQFTRYDVSPAQIASSGDAQRYVAFDATNDRLLLLSLDSSYATGLWAWSPTTKLWSRVAFVGPRPNLHTDDLDIPVVMAGDKLVFFGEVNGGVSSGTARPIETWSFDVRTSSWTQHLGPAPSRRLYHRLAYDSKAGRVLMFGGGVSGGLSNELWAFDPVAGSWAYLDAQNPPPARKQHGFAYDSVNNLGVAWGTGLSDPNVYLYRYEPCLPGATVSCVAEGCAAGVRQCLSSGGYGPCVSSGPASGCPDAGSGFSDAGVLDAGADSGSREVDPGSDSGLLPPQHPDEPPAPGPVETGCGCRSEGGAPWLLFALLAAARLLTARSSRSAPE
ncbi:MAG: hypothetical protein ACOZIN_03970 [Myxococcota bacterium]